MAQPFSFPPPPPPPPKPVQSHVNPVNDSRGVQRGRGSFNNAQQNGRGREHFSGQRGFRGGFAGQGDRTNHYMSSHRHQSQPYSDSKSSDPSWKPQQSTFSHRGQKRNHAAAFHHRGDGSLRNSRPTAPPAVPSFGLDLDSILPKKPEPQKGVAAPSSKKTNLLGLTPATRESDSEDDEDEEAKLANKSTEESLLRFEYKGSTSTLSTPEDIAAWISERRKRWPTEAKREVAQKELEEKKKRFEEEKAKRLEASRAAAKVRQDEWQKQKLEKEKSQIRQRMLKQQIMKSKATSVGDRSQTSAQLKAEKLRRKAEKVAKQLKIAEGELDKLDSTEQILDIPEANDLDSVPGQLTEAAAAHAGTDPLDNNDDTNDSSTTSTSVIKAALQDDTSTSGSSSESDSASDSDSDSGPEQLPSKRAGPDRVPPAARKAPNGTVQQASSSSSAVIDQRPICANFARTGRCKFGRRCHYRHAKPEYKGAQQQSSVGNRRKGLYQVMVEKEREEERMKAVRMIQALGDQGLLDDDNEAEEKSKDEMEGQMSVNIG